MTKETLFFKVLVALLRITQLEIIQRMPKNKPAYYNVTQFLRYVIPGMLFVQIHFIFPVLNYSKERK